MSKKKRNVPALVPEVMPSPGHLKFAEAFVRLDSIKAACEETGFSPHYGKELIKRPDVIHEVTRLREQLQTASGFSLEQAFKQGQRLLAKFEASGDAIACARMFELTVKMAGHLSDRLPEKPTVNVRQALDDAHNAEAMRTAWAEFLKSWKQRALNAPESEGTNERVYETTS